MPTCLNFVVPHHPPIWKYVPGIFPWTSSCLTKSLIKQETLIYSLELTYSTRCFDQTEGKFLAFTQLYKGEFLAGHSLVNLQPLLHSLTPSLHFCSEKTTIWSKICSAPGNCYPWNNPPLQHSIMFENNDSSHKQTNKMLEELLSK